MVLRLTLAIAHLLMALVSSGFIARLDFGELARWGRMVGEIRFQKSEINCSLFF